MYISVLYILPGWHSQQSTRETYRVLWEQGKGMVDAHVGLKVISARGNP
jgi:hypothetical protein